MCNLQLYKIKQKETKQALEQEAYAMSTASLLHLGAFIWASLEN